MQHIFENYGIIIDLSHLKIIAGNIRKMWGYKHKFVCM